MSDCDFDGFCTGDCPGPVPDFRGSFWGVVGRYLTRLPEYIKSHLQTQPADCGDLYYPYPKHRPHPTLSRELPNLTYEGTEYECFGGASTMIADMAKLSTTGSRPSYLWAQLHYVPVGEANLDNAIAALAVASLGDYVEGIATAELGEPTVWIVEDSEGDPEVWDSYDKLDIYTPEKKAFCGVSNFGWIEKRAPTNDDVRLTYYSVGDPEPIISVFDNGARVDDEVAYFRIADVSRDCFPLALGCRPYVTKFGDDTVENFVREWVIGELNTSTGRVERPVTIESDLWDFITEAGLGASNSSLAFYGAGGAERTDDTAALITKTISEVYIRSWEPSAITIYEPDPENPSETIPAKFYGDVAVIHGTDNDARVISSDPMDPEVEWSCRVVTQSPSNTYDNRGGEVVSVGSTLPPRDAVTGRISAHVVRVLPVGFSYRGSQENSSGAAQQVLGVSVRGISSLGGLDPGGITFRMDFDAWLSAPMVSGQNEEGNVETTISGLVVRLGGIDAISVASMDERLSDEAPRNKPQPYAGTVRTPLDVDSGSTPEPVVRIIGVGMRQQRDIDRWLTTEGDDIRPPDTDYLPTDWRWTNGKRPDLIIERAMAWTCLNGGEDSEGGAAFSCAPFYDSSEDGLLQVIPAPSGFFKDAVTGDIYRGNFAIQQRIDDHHPTDEMIWAPEVTGFIE